MYLYVSKEELDKYLKEGYTKGTGVHMKGTSGKVWINKEENEIYYNKEDLEEYLLNGWIKGRIKRKK